MDKPIAKIRIFHRPNDSKAAAWQNKINRWLKVHHPKVKITEKDYEILIVLGGDGTMLEAAKACQPRPERRDKKAGALMLGLNLGTEGFLASVRNPQDFLKALQRLLKGDFHLTERGMLKAEVFRNKKIVFSANALNEVAVLNPLGMVKIKVRIDGHPVQQIKGTGIMVATATGSTAYNLSAHGPVVMPEAKNFILTELLDHNIPTPSIVLEETQKINLHIHEFRKRELLAITKTRKKFDVLFIADGETIFPLQKDDNVLVRRSPSRVRFVEFEKNYFLKSLRDKFAFK